VIVAIDARMWDMPATGTGRYTRNMIRALLALGGGNDYVLLGNACAGLHRMGVPHARFTTPDDPAPVCNPSWEQLRLPTLLERCGTQVLFSPTGIAPAVKVCPQVVTVHDIAFEFYPELYPPALRGYLGAWVPESVAAADMVVPVSEHTAQTLVELYGLGEDRIRVVYPAVDPDVARAADAAATRTVRDALGVSSRYALTLCSGAANKNLRGSLAALHMARRCADGKDLLLVMAGKPHSSPPAADDADAVVWVDNPDDQQLRALYQGAEVFLFLSLYEGFGLPVLEAMAAGVPVICSCRGALPEIAGGAALLVDPEDPEDVAARLLSVWGDRSLRQELRERGLQRSARFSWHRSAQQLLGVLESVA